MYIPANATTKRVFYMLISEELVSLTSNPPILSSIISEYI